jgi:hypothetical protein
MRRKESKKEDNMFVACIFFTTYSSEVGEYID